MPVEDRLNLLRKLVEVFESRYDEMVEAVSVEMGAPYNLSKDSQAAWGPGHINATIVAAKEFDW